jgi:hypothetical protein
MRSTAIRNNRAVTTSVSWHRAPPEFGGSCEKNGRPQNAAKYGFIFWRPSPRPIFNLKIIGLAYADYVRLMAGKAAIAYIFH